MSNKCFNNFIFIVFLEFMLLNNALFGELPEYKTILYKPKGCKQLLSEFKDKCQLLVICSLEHAVPVTFCKHCSTQYFEVLDSYELLLNSNDTIPNQHNLRCRDAYLDQDRLNIVQILYSNVVGLWNEAYCAGCYSNRTLNNQTNNFFDKNVAFTECINQQDNNTEGICSVCDFYYTDLNKYFNYVIKESDNDKVCFDVQDQMNRTRSMWSKTFKCCQRPVNLTGFALVSSVFACLPIVFYVGMYYYTKRQEANEAEILTDNPSVVENNTRSSMHLVINNFNELNNTNELPQQSTSDPTNITGKIITDMESNDIQKKKKINAPKIMDDDDEPPLFALNLGTDISPIIAGPSRGGNLDDDLLNVKNSYEDNNNFFAKKNIPSKDITIPAEIHKEPKLINFNA